MWSFFRNFYQHTSTQIHINENINTLTHTLTLTQIYVDVYCCSYKKLRKTKTTTTTTINLSEKWTHIRRFSSFSYIFWSFPTFDDFFITCHLFYHLSLFPLGRCCCCCLGFLFAFYCICVCVEKIEEKRLMTLQDSCTWEKEKWQLFVVLCLLIFLYLFGLLFAENLSTKQLQNKTFPAVLEQTTTMTTTLLLNTLTQNRWQGRQLWICVQCMQVAEKSGRGRKMSLLKFVQFSRKNRHKNVGQINFEHTHRLRTNTPTTLLTHWRGENCETNAKPSIINVENHHPNWPLPKCESVCVWQNITFE